MQLQIESPVLDDYLQEIEGVISFTSPVVQKVIQHIESQTTVPEKKAQRAFNYARDQIDHLFDTNSKIISISADDAIQNKEGICFAKAHVLAALLRGMGIPTGFCYQRVIRKGTVESSYALHGLNAIYLEEYVWFRVDPRGNKEGIQSEFSITEEKLAYPIREALGEIDYPHIYVHPLKSVLQSMEQADDYHALFHERPTAIS